MGDQVTPKLSREQKMGAILLSLFAVFAVVLGILQIRNTMYRPFALTKTTPPVTRQDIESAETLVYRDTDNDGLNDFDELYVYRTSAYLADTDSDGMTDKQEVESNKNPLCPEGRDCDEFDIGYQSTAGVTTTVTGTVLLEQPTPVNTLEDLDRLLNDPAAIRALLLQSSVDKKVLEGTSDADLLRMVKEIMGSSTFKIPQP